MASTSIGTNMVYTQPGKKSGKSAGKKSGGDSKGSVHADAKRMFASGQITKAQYDKICAKMGK